MMSRTLSEPDTRGQDEKLFDGGVADGEAADGCRTTVDHNVAAQVRKIATVFAGAVDVIGVWVVYAQREVIAAVWIEEFDAIEPFGYLFIAFTKLRDRTPRSRPGWDRRDELRASLRRRMRRARAVSPP